MRVMGNDDGSFVFIFTSDEKELGVQLLRSLRAADKEVQRAIDLSIQEILWAGIEMPSNKIN